jgi:hypothetical protein
MQTLCALYKYISFEFSTAMNIETSITKTMLFLNCLPEKEIKQIDFIGH